MTRILLFVVVVLSISLADSVLAQMSSTNATVGHFIEPVGSVQLDRPMGENGNNRVPDPRHPLSSMSGLGDIIAGDTLTKLEYSIFDIDVHDPGPTFPPLSPTGNSRYSRSNGPIPAIPTALPLLVLSGLAAGRRRR